MRFAAALLLLWSYFVTPLVAREKELYGLLQAVDAKKGVLTLTPAGEKEAKRYSLVKRDLPVTHALGHDLKLEDLRPRQRILLRLDEDDENVLAIRLDTDCLWGSITELDVAQNTLTVKVNYIPRKLELTPEVRLLRDGAPVRLADLRVNLGVELVYAPDQRRILQVRLGRGISGSNPYCTLRTGSGLLLDVDHARRRLQVVGLSERYDKQEYEYEGWTAARLVYSNIVLREVDIRALAAPCRVSFYSFSDTNRLATLSVEVPRLTRRTVAKFDNARRKLTLHLDEDVTEAFDVAADVKVLHGTEPGVLDAVREGGAVSVGLTLDNKEVILLQVLDK